jgi:hypothetical protein
MRRFERRRHSVASAFIPLSFSPGEAYQFDFSHEHVELGGIELSRPDRSQHAAAQVSECCRLESHDAPATGALGASVASAKLR